MSSRNFYDFGSEIASAKKQSPVVRSILDQAESIKAHEAGQFQQTIRKRLMDKMNPLSSDEQFAFGLALAIAQAKISGVDYNVSSPTVEDKEQEYLTTLAADKHAAELAGNVFEVDRLKGILDAHTQQEARKHIVNGWAEKTAETIAADRAASVIRAEEKFTEFRSQRVAALAQAYRGARTYEQIATEWDRSSEAQNARSNINATVVLKESSSGG